MAEDEALIKQKFLLLEQIKTLLNSVCGTMARLSEQMKQKHSEAAMALSKQFEMLKCQITQREMFFTTHLQKLEMEINHVHQLSLIIQQSSKTYNYAEAFDLEIPDLTWMDAVLMRFHREKDPTWLAMKNSVHRWNSIAELSRKTPRTRTPGPPIETLTEFATNPPIGNSENMEDCIMLNEQNISMESTLTITSNDPLLANIVVVSPLPTAVISHSSNNFNEHFNFIEETTETWGTDAHGQAQPVQIVPMPPQQESSSASQTSNTTNQSTILVRCLTSPPSRSISPTLTYHVPESMNNRTSKLPVTVQPLIPVVLTSSDAPQCSLQPPPAKRKKLDLATTQIPEKDNSFGGIKLKPSLIAGMLSKGIVEPWPPQGEGIACILEGRDVILNYTKGKTSVAIIGALQRVSECIEAPQAIILYPSLQAAQSSHKLCQELTSMMGIKSVVLISEETLSLHNIQKNNFAHVIFTTPWILQKIHLINPKLYDTTKLLVLDGAKKLLELHSFKSAILKIASRLNMDTQIVVLTRGMSARLADLMKQVLRNPVAVNDNQDMPSPRLESATEIQIKYTHSPSSCSSTASCDYEVSSDIACNIIERRDSSVSTSGGGCFDRIDGVNLESSTTENLNNDTAAENLNEDAVATTGNVDPDVTPSGNCSPDFEILEVIDVNSQSGIPNYSASIEHYYIKTDCNEEKLLCLKALEQKMVQDQAYIVCNGLEKSVYLFQKLNAIKVECHLLLDEHLELKAEIISRFLEGSVRILILTHETLVRSGGVLKRVPFLFNYDFPLDEGTYCERLMHTGYDHDKDFASDINRINVFSFLTESGMETVERLQTKHAIVLKDFQSEII